MTTLIRAAMVAMASVLLVNPFCVAQDYSLVIGVDGMGSYGYEAANTASMHSIADGSWASGYRGARALNAYAGGVLGTPTQQPTISGPGWSTLHTGVWVDEHNVTDNGASFVNGKFNGTPSYLKVLEAHVASITTSGIVSWNPIDDNILAPGNGSPNIDSRTGTNEDDALTTSTAVSQLGAWAAGVDGAMFVHIDAVDLTSHSAGAYSAANLAAVAGVDAQVGQMLNAIKARPTFASENWQVMIVSDHGHVAGGGHGGQSQLERTVPILVSSKTLAGGVVTAAVRTPSQVDVAPTVLAHFGVAKPGYMAGQSLLTATTPTVGASLGTGLVSHMDFDGDVSGSYAGDGGTASGAVTFAAGRFGQAGKVATYGAGHVTLNDDIAAAFGTSSDFALSMWIKYDSAASDPAFFSNKNWDNGANTGINLAYQPSNGGLDVNTKSATGVRRDVEPYSGFEAHTWHHVLLNFDRDGKTSLYIDGSFFGDNETSVGTLDGAYRFTFFNDGTGAYAASGLSLTNQMIDEFGAWSRLLTADEIGFLAENPLSAALEPVLAGDFNEDGAVDGADFLAWQRGQSPSPLSAGDLSAWQAGFGTGGAAAVPEPAAWMVLSSGAGALALRVRFEARDRHRISSRHTT